MSKKILRITVLILLLIGVGIILYGGLFQQVTTADIPKDVPIIHGKVVSIKTFRSDELKGEYRLSSRRMLLSLR